MMAETKMLRRVEFNLPELDDSRAVFPFSIPALRSLEVLETDTPVVLFVGENGSGKSTLMEALAIATRLPTVGAESAAPGDDLEHVTLMRDFLASPERFLRHLWTTEGAKSP